MSALETLRVDFLLDMQYHYAIGQHAAEFFTQLRDHARLMGMRCPQCNRTYIPPRPVCGICYQELQQWVEVGPEGTIVGWTVVRIPFIDPMTGEQRPVPYGFAIIRLDGAATSLYHFLDETDERKIGVGKRVRAIFRERREGSLRDISHFRLIEA
jgi:uncharacterized OB-fold protein